MANCAIVGINWGDEGKGRMVDYLTGQYDVVVRYQGGGNAGHTVINDMGKFALHLLPSGVFRPGVMNILGNGVALDCENLVTEMETIRAAGVSISPENLMVSHRASLLLPWHRELDALEEARLKDKMYGSTKQGIAPFYSDKYQKKTIQAGELLYPDRLMAHLQDLLEWKNLILQKVYGAKGYTMAEMTAWLETYAAQVRPYVADTGRYLRQAQTEGKAILFEGQLGALRDLDYGIYPYTTSSNAIAAYAPVGSGLPTAKLDEVVGAPLTACRLSRGLNTSTSCSPDVSSGRCLPIYPWRRLNRRTYFAPLLHGMNMTWYGLSSVSKAAMHALKNSIPCILPSLKRYSERQNARCSLPIRSFHREG